MESSGRLSGDFDSLSSGRWDKLQPWSNVRAEIKEKLAEPDKFNHNITISHGPQLLHTMRHSNPIRCMTHHTSKKGEVFTTHGCHGACSHTSLWTLESDNNINMRRFEMPRLYTQMVHVTKHRVYFAFSEDMTVRIFTEPNSSCREVGSKPSPTRVLSMIYNKEEDEVIAGGRGGLHRWTVTGSEHAAKLSRGRDFDLKISLSRWILDLKLEYKHKLLLAVSEEGIYIINYELNKQVAFLFNWHVGSMTSCCLYNHGEYIITGSTDGGIKVWNGVVYTIVHDFKGHVDRISALHTHSKEPIVLSCSYDGSVYLWRMDNFQKFLRVDLGEKIYSMDLLRSNELFCQTLREIRIYDLNQFFVIFAPVESTIYHLCRLPGNDHTPNRVLASTEDGSVRIFSPTTGATVTISYPLPSFQIFKEFAYNNEDGKLCSLLTEGKALQVNCHSNPCEALEILEPVQPDEKLECVLSLKVRLGVKKDTTDIIFLAGLRNGQISLLEANICTMKPIQAHKGYVGCLEAIAELDYYGHKWEEFQRVVISGGSDYTMKFWKISSDCHGRVTLLNLKTIDWFPMPVFLKIFHNRMAVVTVEARCSLMMNQLKSLDNDTKDFKLIPFTHTLDYDHSDYVTALDMCPILRLFATAGKDGSVKIWDCENDLIRELDFRFPLYSMCFANTRGDLIIGFSTNLVVVSIAKYLTYEQLEHVVNYDFDDDYREKPISFNHDVIPWVDPNRLPKYPANVRLRRAAKTKQSVEGQIKYSNVLVNIHDLLPESSDLMNLIITPIEKPLGESGRTVSPAKRLANITYGCARALGLSIAEDAQVEEIRRRSLKMISSKGTDTGSKKDDSSAISKKPSSISEVPEPEDDKLSTTTGTVVKQHTESQATYDSGATMKEEQIVDKLMQLMPWERELLARDPIIAPDGYIPNSVIRERINYVPFVEKPESQWRLKYAPSHDPKFLPEGWSEEIEEVTYKSPSRVIRTEKNRAIPPPVFVEEKQEKNIEEQVVEERHIFILPEREKFQIKEEKKTKPKKRKESPKKSAERKKYEYIRPNLDLDLHRKKADLIEEEGPSSPKTMIETMHETDEVTESDDETKVDPRDQLPEELRKLLDLPWFPQCEITAEAILSTLINLLASDDPLVFASACEYITEIYHSMNLAEEYGDLIEELLLKSLQHENPEIVQSALTMTRKLELRGPNLMTAVLPHLLSDMEGVRAEAMLLVNTLAGVENKDGLRRLMVDLKIIRSLDSCATEAEALDILRRKLGLPERVRIQKEQSSRISDWVDGTAPGVFDSERKKVEKKTRQDALIRRWSIKAKLQQSGQTVDKTQSDSSQDDDAWQQWDSLRKGAKSSSDEEETVAKAISTVTTVDIPGDNFVARARKPREKKEKPKRKPKKKTVAEIETEAPPASRVTRYEESCSSSGITFSTSSRSHIEYWETPSTLSDDVVSYYSPSDFDESDYSEEISNPSREDSSNRRTLTEMLSPGKTKEIKPHKPEHKSQPIKFFRPKLLTLGDYLKSKAKVAKPDKRNKSRARNRRQVRANPKTGPSDGLKKYAAYASNLKQEKETKNLQGTETESAAGDASGIGREHLGTEDSRKTQERLSSDVATLKDDGGEGKGSKASGVTFSSDSAQEMMTKHKKQEYPADNQPRDVSLKHQSPDLSTINIPQDRFPFQGANRKHDHECPSFFDFTEEERVFIKEKIMEVRNQRDGKIGENAGGKYEGNKAKDILEKLLLRQQYGIETPEEREFAYIYLNDVDEELRDLARRYYANLPKDKAFGMHENEEDVGRMYIDQEDSGINDINIQEQPTRKREILVHQDSGIARDLSESSTFSHVTTYHGLKGTFLKHDRTLSPVKSCSNIDQKISPGHRSRSPDKIQKATGASKDSTSSVTGSKKARKVKDEHESSDIKACSLPPIRYYKDGLPATPEGFRTQHTVHFDREKTFSQRYGVQQINGRFSYQTQEQRDVDLGSVKMRGKIVIPGAVGISQQNAAHLKSLSTSSRTDPKSSTLVDGKDFSWDNPLPPAPPRASLTMVNPSNVHYCQHYRLAKKKLHHYTSVDIRKLCLPGIHSLHGRFKRYSRTTQEYNDVSGENQKEKHEKQLPKNTRKVVHTPVNKKDAAQKPAEKLSQLPPITLNQLIGGIKIDSCYPVYDAIYENL